MTVSSIYHLEVIMKNRRSRIEGLTALVLSGKCSKKDLEWIQAEIAEHEKFIADTEKEIKDFKKMYYKPAMVM